VVDYVNTIFTGMKKVIKEGHSCGQQYILQKGLKLFGKCGYDAICKELGQLDNRVCFDPIHIKDMTAAERRHAQVVLAYLMEKRDGTCKGCAVYNGKLTREWLSKDNSGSPTCSLEAIFLTAMIDADEERDIMTSNIPNAFIQTPMDIKEGEERVIMKITGVLVDILVEKNPERYTGYVVYENGKKVLYVIILKAIYGMLQAALLWYKKLRADLEAIGYTFNNYDPCVANKIINGKQMTVRFHVDNTMSSHEDSKVNGDFLTWLNSMYGEIGEVTCTRGKVHDYLGMTF
jgi:hypothetical protein